MLSDGSTMKSLENLSGYKVLLASASPRRRELLGMLGVEFSVARGLEIDESYPDTIDVEDVASYISKKKSDAYREFISAGELIITADTVVIDNGCVLGKPVDAEDAIRMLRSLSGHGHKVITGVTIATVDRQVSFSVGTEVEFAHLEEDEIREYVELFNPLDKAGAYGIQEWIGCIGVKSISGSYYNVMGLPLHRLYTELKQF